MLFYIFIYFTLQTTLAESPHDYYWRDWDPKCIPTDAIPAGRDTNGEKIYIGRSYIHTSGVAVIPLYYDKNTDKAIVATGVKPTTAIKRVLCSESPKKFKWIRVKGDTLHLDLIGKTAVIGGYDHERGQPGRLLVGRVQFEGEIIIGSVPSYLLDKSKLLFVGNGQKKEVNSFELLIVDNDVDNL